ncbi:MAG: hypothetical protein IJI48_06830, partial [Ruminococcus sp.]|nr:hypothetical protein [Ruminococcus sp.]
PLSEIIARANDENGNIKKITVSGSDAYELAVAMECRCYQGGEGRTRMKQLHLGKRDAVCIVVGLLVIAAVVLLDIFFAAYV